MAELVGNVTEIATNVEFQGAYKSKLKREEDIIAMTRRGNLIYASCKFPFRKLSSRTGPQSAAARTQGEISRLGALQLPFRFPEERIVRVLITSTPCLASAGDKGDVIVTNLKGMADNLKSL